MLHSESGNISANHQNYLVTRLLATHVLGAHENAMWVYCLHQEAEKNDRNAKSKQLAK
jgi:hypothetical protein